MTSPVVNLQFVYFVLKQESGSMKTTAPVVLVIEDHPVMLENLAVLLERQGYTVETAENGRIGISRARQQRPDLIICDLSMPLWNGKAVLETIRAHPPMSDIPFIMLTAEDDPITEKHCLQIGASRFVSKSNCTEELIQAVEDLLHKSAVR